MKAEHTASATVGRIKGLGKRMAVPAGLEPATSAFEARRSIQLSYGTVPGLDRGETLQRESTIAYNDVPVSASVL